MADHTGFDITATLAQLFVYPIKSCAGIAMVQAQLLETGLVYDRSWMLVDTEGQFLSQRELPRMALIHPELDESSDTLVVRAPGMPALQVPLAEPESGAAGGATCEVQVWRDQLPAWDVGAVAAAWFSQFLGQPVRLVRFDKRQRRWASTDWTGGLAVPTQFSDGYPVLVVGQSALDNLNDRLRGAGHGAVGIERFRPNLVLAGLEAHDEDRVGMLHIHSHGDSGEEMVQLQPVKPCPRCPIPNVDPATGVSSPTVGDMLQSYRQDPRLDGAISFGMNAIVRAGSGAWLRVGQAVGANIRFE